MRNCQSRLSSYWRNDGLAPVLLTEESFHFVGALEFSTIGK